jgi:SAM-dependent methyltransferase
MGVNNSNFILLREFSRRRELGALLSFGRLFNSMTDAERRRAQASGLPAGALRGKETEALFEALGASGVTSLDVSERDGCDLLADLTCDFASDPAFAAHLGRYDTILDYGTSEHVFNPLQALVNAYNLLRDGGVYVFDLPVSGWISHAVYQFTPSYFLSLGETPFFELEHLLYHRKRGERILRIKHYNGFSYAQINGRKRYSSWGVLRKTGGGEQRAPLALEELRVLQCDPRDTGQDRKISLLGRLGSVERLNATSLQRYFADAGLPPQKPSESAPESERTFEKAELHP